MEVKPNIIVMNFESVDRFTYDLLPQKTRDKYKKFELPNSISVTKKGVIPLTVEAHQNILGNDLKKYSDMGYYTLYVTNSRYYPMSWEKSVKPFGVKSGYSEWLYSIFDHYWNLNVGPKMDFKHMITYLNKRIKPGMKPLFMMIQEMDTHNPFNSTYNPNFNNMWSQITELVTKNDLLKLDERLRQKGLENKYKNIPRESPITLMCICSIYNDLDLELFDNYIQIKQILNNSRKIQLTIIDKLLNDLFTYLDSLDNTIFHIIGDHHMGCGDMDGIIGNLAYLNVDKFPKYGNTIWLTNQELDKNKTYYTYNFQDIISDVF